MGLRTANTKDGNKISSSVTNLTRLFYTARHLVMIPVLALTRETQIILQNS